MTRYTCPVPEKKSQLMGSSLPSLDLIDGHPGSYKASTDASTSVSDSESMDGSGENQSSPAFQTLGDGSEHSEACATATSESQQPLENGDSGPCTVSTNPRDVFKNAIPLPPGPSGSYAVGSACGGNQSYVGLKDAVHRLPDSNISGASDFLDGGFNSDLAPSAVVRSAGVVGLNNLGNTCFMNSGLQCLINTAPVVEFFLKSGNINGVAPGKTALVPQFQSLIRNAWLGNSSPLSLQEFKNVLGNNCPQFKDCRQHDCQEFLQLTLDVMHEQLKSWNNLKRGDESYVNGSSSSSKSTNASSSASDSSVTDMEVVGKEEDSPELQKDSPQTKRRRLTEDSNEDKGGDGDAGVMTNGHHSEESNPEIADNVNPVGADISLEAQAQQANEFWSNYIKDNNTVIASSFEGLLKSTVTCSQCKFVSRTYDPFMYLPLPIPRMMERQFAVSFSGCSDPRLTKADVTLTVGDSVGRLKEAVLKNVYGDVQMGVPLSSYVVAEVVNHHVIRMLEDDASLKTVYDGNRNIYVYELNQNFEDLSEGAVNGPWLEDTTPVRIPADAFQGAELKPSTYLDEDWENEDSVQIPQPSVYTPSPSQVAGFVSSGDSGFAGGGQLSATTTTDTGCQPASMDWLPCAVCLEDLVKSDLRQHYGCSCILCVDCMKKTATHYETVDNKDRSTEGCKTLMKCPVCAVEVDYEKSFLPVVDTQQGTARKLLTVPLLFRHESTFDANNNSPVVSKLFNHPSLVKLPSVIKATELRGFLNSLNPFPNQEFTVINASWDGKSCGQCIYSTTCRGCELPSDGYIYLNPRNSILISYSDLSPDLVAQVEPSDMAIQVGYVPAIGWTRREEPPIDIHECLNEFSEIEYLDDQNPWFCPKCKQNRCATKALTICRFPDYLIVYLKRFVFVDQSSNKLNNRLKFPINDLDVSKYIAEEFAGAEHVYDLYSCVCHFGTASAGHYTAFGKNPVNGMWHYFNDETYSSKIPSEPEFASAYVLFYERKGLKSDIPLNRRPSPIVPRFRLSTSFFNDRDVSKDASPALPDSEFVSGLYGPYLGGTENGIDGCLPLDQQEELNSIRSDETDNFPGPREPRYYHKSSTIVTEEEGAQSPGGSEKLNGVGEDVSRMHLRESNDNASNSVRRKTPVQKGKDALSGFRSREGKVDDGNEGFSTPLRRSSGSQTTPSPENGRPTKLAARPRNSHPPPSDQEMEN